jgi:phytol kinase
LLSKKLSDGQQLMESTSQTLINNPWIGIGLVIVSLSLLMIALKWIQAKLNPHPEVVRKALHTIMGLITLTFPWVFQETWPVWLLAGVSMVALAAVKSLSFMKKQLGDVIDGVKRRSLGDLYFPLAVAIVFQLSQNHLLLYLVPIMLLTFADAVAAIIGVRYGSRQYHTTEGIKTIEGSLAFFIVAFFSVAIPLLLLSDRDVYQIMLIASILGVLIMLFEAVAWRGLDNLFIPLGAFFLLEIYLVTSTWGLVFRFLVLLGLGGAVLWGRKRTPLNEGAALTSILVLYAIWVLGGLEWLLAPVLLIIVYVLLAKQAKQQGSGEHSTFAIISITIAPILWLFVSLTDKTPELVKIPVYYMAYLAAFAIQIALIAVANFGFRWPQKNRWLIGVNSFLLACGVMSIPVLRGLGIQFDLTTGFQEHALLYGLLLLLAVLLSVIVFILWQPKLNDCPVDTNRWLRQGLIGIVGSSLLLLSGFIL